MKINRQVLSIALGGAILPLGLASANDSLPLPKPMSSVGSLSDLPTSVNNSVATRQRPVQSVDMRPEAFRDNEAIRSSHSGATRPVPRPFHSASYSSTQDGHANLSPMPDSGPMTIHDHSEYVEASGGCSSGSCGSGSYGSVDCSSGSCDSFGVNPRRSQRSGFGGCNTGFNLGRGCRGGWLETEALLWWGPVGRTPPLAATLDANENITSILAGGDETYGGQMVPGLRANVGRWLDSCQSIGIGGRAFGLFDQPTTQTFTDNNGTRNLGVPFFNTTLGGDDAYVAAFNFGGNLGRDPGQIAITNDTDFIGADAYGRILLARSGCSRADVIGGYSFARLDDSIVLNTFKTNQSVDNVLDGTTFATIDAFSTKNTFHGGHVGFLSDINKGRFTLSTLGKVAIGTMQQEGLISGSSQINGAQTTSNNGILTYPSNKGTQRRDVLAFMPEAGAKLRVCLKKNVSFNVGYTFLFLSDVALAGDMINPIVDVQGALNTANNPTDPRPKFDHGCYYLHGVDLGLNIKF
jgi:Putative beta barrel porin-7 (BBP7)